MNPFLVAYTDKRQDWEHANIRALWNDVDWWYVFYPSATII